MTNSTADLTDAHPDARLVFAQYKNYGKQQSFSGQAVTAKVYEDNSVYRALVKTAGNGKVLVVDGGASLRYALLGDMLAESAMNNNWAGILIHGAVRDTAILNELNFSVKALGSCPRKSVKRDEGLLNIPIYIENTLIQPGDWIYADTDGVIVSDHKLD